MTDSSATRSLSNTGAGWNTRDGRRVLAPIGLFVLAEAAILGQQIIFGLLVHAAMLLGLLGLIAYSADHPVFEGLLFVPLLRILNLGTGIISFEPLLWIVGVYLLLLGSMVLVMRGHDLGLDGIGLRPPRTIREGAIVIAGIVTGAGFGVIQWVFDLESLPVAPTLANALLSALILGLLVGFVEELLFRGLLQRWVADVISTRGSIIVVSVLFGFMHSIWFNVGDVAFAFGVSLLIGWLYARTRNFWSIWMIHAMINVMAFAVLPLVAG